MFKPISILLGFSTLVFLNACNPDCQSITGIRIIPEVSPETFQVLVTAPEVASLKGRKVFFGDIEAETSFVDDIGLVTKVPAGMNSGNVQVRIEDLDCNDILVNNGFQVVNQNDYFNTPDFISPTPPEFIIPSIPPSFPPSIDNAWLSPQAVDYCLWFIALKDTVDASVSPPIIRDLTTLDPRVSFEQSTCGAGDPNVLYQQNPITGIIDPAENFIDITIDRRNSTGGTESYTGEFIDMDQTPYNAATFNLCTPSAPELGKTGHMMLLTSKKTGRQTLAFQPDL